MRRGDPQFLNRRHQGREHQLRASNAPQRDPLKVFVGSIPGDMDQQSLKAYFSKFGRISNIKLTFKTKHVNRGYCIVSCADRATYDLLLAQKIQLKGRRLECRPYMKDSQLVAFRQSYNLRRVYVYNILAKISDEEVKALFERKIGPVENAYCIRKQVGGGSGGRGGRPGKKKKKDLVFGFVLFRREEDAQQAVRVAYLTYKGSRIKIKPFEAKHQAGEAAAARREGGGSRGGRRDGGRGFEEGEGFDAFQGGDRVARGLDLSSEGDMGFEGPEDLEMQIRRYQRFKRSQRGDGGGSGGHGDHRESGQPPIPVNAPKNEKFENIDNFGPSGGNRRRRPVYHRQGSDQTGRSGLPLFSAAQEQRFLSNQKNQNSGLSASFGDNMGQRGPQQNPEAPSNPHKFGELGQNVQTGSNSIFDRIRPASRFYDQADAEDPSRGLEYAGEGSRMLVGGFGEEKIESSSFGENRQNLGNKASLGYPRYNEEHSGGFRNREEHRMRPSGHYPYENQKNQKNTKNQLFEPEEDAGRHQDAQRDHHQHQHSKNHHQGPYTSQRAGNRPDQEYSRQGDFHIPGQYTTNNNVPQPHQSPLNTPQAPHPAPESRIYQNQIQPETSNNNPLRRDPEALQRRRAELRSLTDLFSVNRDTRPISGLCCQESTAVARNHPSWNIRLNLPFQSAQSRKGGQAESRDLQIEQQRPQKFIFEKRPPQLTEGLYSGLRMFRSSPEIGQYEGNNKADLDEQFGL